MVEVIISLVIVIGVLASTRIGNTLSKDASREYVLFSRAHERREQILTELYGMLLNTKSALYDYALVLQPLYVKVKHGFTGEEATALTNKTEMKFKKSLKDTRQFYRMNAIWLQPQLCEEIEYVLTELFNELQMDLAVASITTPDKREKKAEQTIAWITEVANPAIKKLETEFRLVLGISE
ncbi:hypothetical protein BH24ACT22_BH24ACT22_00860 [soil metagenome]